MRCTLAMACSIVCGLNQRSEKMTWLAAAMLSPTPPEWMVARSTCHIQLQSVLYVRLQPLLHMVAASIARIDGGEAHARPIDGAEGL